MLRVRDLLTALMLAQFAWGGSALAQTVGRGNIGRARRRTSASVALPGRTLLGRTRGFPGVIQRGPTPLSATATPAPYIGARSDPGAVERSDRRVGSLPLCGQFLTTNSYFVPFNSESEWKAFIDNAPVSHSADTYCSRATQISVEPEAVCTQYTPVSPPPAFALPYARNGNGDPTADRS